MRMIVIAVLTAVGIGFLGISPMLAAPATGSVIDKAAAITSPVTKVPCAVRRACGYHGCVRRRVCW